MADIFLSYSREDESRIRDLVSQIEAHGWSVFWDRRIPAGETWRSHIGSALQDARCIVVAWSKHSIDSQWVAEEADEGKTRRILIPLLLDRVQPPRGFREIQAADISDWHAGQTSERYNELIEDLRRLLGKQPEKSRETPHPAQPLHIERTRERAAASRYRTVLATVDEEPRISSGVSRPLKYWLVILVSPAAWLIGHAASLFVTGIGLSLFVVTGTIGGLLIVIIVTWLATSLTNTMKLVRRGQLGRIAVYFVLAGLVAGFVGLLLWLVGCAESMDYAARQLIGCRDKITLAWKLFVGFSALLALAGASVVLVIEIGSTKFRNRAHVGDGAHWDA